jgi:hypothetical protein
MKRPWAVSLAAKMTANGLNMPLEPINLREFAQTDRNEVQEKVIQAVETDPTPLQEGRGASVEAMAGIQGSLPKGLAAIHEHFGDAVAFSIFDRRPGMDRAIRVDGWENLTELESEGDYEHIKHRINTAIDQHEADGTASAAAIREARGLAPLSRDRPLSEPDVAQPELAPARSPEGPEHGQLPAARDDAPAGGLKSSQVDADAQKENALARSIEAEQARLTSQTPVERYNSAIRTYIDSNAERLETVQTQLQADLETQQGKLGDLTVQKPGFLSSGKAKNQWRSEVEEAQSQIQNLQKGLERVIVLKEEVEANTEDEVRRADPDLAKARDEELRRKRLQELEERERARARSREIDRERSLERGLERAREQG